MLASLPMYDLPAMRAHTDAWWLAIVDALRRQGLVPETSKRITPAEWPILDRACDNYDVWRAPSLLLSQTCGYPLKYQLQDDAQLVAVPEYDVPGCDGPRYSSVVVVRDDDPARAIEDLRGYRCAYNATHSQSGYNALRHLLAPLASGEPFFSKTLATGAHRGSMVAVRDREADVCAVDCVTWALSQDVENCCDGLRIVALTASAPALPYITHRLRSNVDVAALQDALMDALQQVSGVTRSVLRLRGFSVLSSKDYDVICEMQDAAIELGFPELQ